jgi:hypothetical protein
MVSSHRSSGQSCRKGVGTPGCQLWALEAAREKYTGAIVLLLGLLGAKSLAKVPFTHGSAPSVQGMRCVWGSLRESDEQEVVSTFKSSEGSN